MYRSRVRAGLTQKEADALISAAIAGEMEFKESRESARDCAALDRAIGKMVGALNAARGRDRAKGRTATNG